MSDLVTESKKMSLFQRGVLQNPITLKELRSRMRGRRAFVILSLYLLATCTIIFFTYLFLVIDNSTTATAGQFAGQAIFFLMVSIQMFLVIFVAPAFTAGAITGEKERQTFELLRTTLMSPRRFVFGKMISALGYVLLLIVSTIPLISLAFMIGGISWIEIIVSQAMLIAGAFTYSLMGLYFSSRMKTTLAATVTTYIVTLAILIGLPLVVFLGGLVLSPFILIAASSSDWLTAAATYGAILVGFTNLPSSMIAAETMLISQNAVWGYWETGPATYFVPSTWYGTLLFHLLVSRLFFRWTVKQVSKISE
ncbi:MAG: ABC-2 type transport system permease protein [Cellvibrionaceae bacterium]|jgi:ABC-2 type transport system permease protein